MKNSDAKSRKLLKTKSNRSTLVSCIFSGLSEHSKPLIIIILETELLKFKVTSSHVLQEIITGMREQRPISSTSSRLSHIRSFGKVFYEYIYPLQYFISKIEETNIHVNKENNKLVTFMKLVTLSFPVPISLFQIILHTSLLEQLHMFSAPSQQCILLVG